MRKPISFEMIKIEAENHGFRNVVVKATFGNYGYAVFQYTPRVDPNNQCWAAIKLRPNGKFVKPNPHERTWILRTNPLELLDMFGEAIYKH